MKEEAKQELSMRDRLIALLAMPLDAEPERDRDVADYIVERLIAAASKSYDGKMETPLNAIKFVFETVDGPQIDSYSVANYASPNPVTGQPYEGPVVANGVKHRFPGMTRDGYAFGNDPRLEPTTMLNGNMGRHR